MTEEAIPVTKDLRELKGSANDWPNKEYAFVEVAPHMLNEGEMIYSDRHRYLTALRYLRKGYGGYAVLRGRVVVGDAWYVAGERGHRPGHADLKWLNINLREKEAYGFGLFLDPNHRGNNLATLFLRAILYALRAKGFEKQYGFYWGDDRPALWMHRMLKFHELKKRRKIRLLYFFEKGMDG